jgi:hypothetical protein
MPWTFSGQTGASSAAIGPCRRSPRAWTWFDVVVDDVAGLSPVEREAVLTGIACAVYRVVPHAVQR